MSYFILCVFSAALEELGEGIEGSLTVIIYHLMINTTNKINDTRNNKKQRTTVRSEVRTGCSVTSIEKKVRRKRRKKIKAARCI